MFVLARFPGCTEFYRGPHQGDSSFVVGRGHADVERVFKRKDLVAASDYAKETRMQIEPVPNSSLCRGAVTQLWDEG